MPRPQRSGNSSTTRSARSRPAATYYLGEIYATSAARCASRSGRPASVGAKLQEYEDALDEEAFPFEEKAIKVHEKNLELMSGDRLFNSWIEKSLARLAELMPGRYAKAEISSGFLGSIDRYAYRSPAAEAAAAAAAAAAQSTASTTPANAATSGGANATLR